MNISIIAAISSNKVIGFQKSIPWILSVDLAWFKRITLNKPVIMGRITYESIGKPLLERLNIIISNTYHDKDHENIIWVNSIDQALVAAGIVEEIMIIGGRKIYELFLPMSNRLYLTHVDLEVIGDTYFPFYNINEWKSVFNEYHKADKKNSYDYCFEILERSF
ncbi:MAG: type 3 dihydrofolate reductase [Arsenophonus sp.]